MMSMMIEDVASYFDANGPCIVYAEAQSAVTSLGEELLCDRERYTRIDVPKMPQRRA